MLATVTDNSPRSINTSLFSLQQQIDELQKLNNDLLKQIKDLSERLYKLEAVH